MKDAIAEMFASKKFLAFAASAIAVIVIRLAGKAGFAIDADTAASIADRVVALASAYLLGQAIADHGKEAAQIHADARAVLPAGPSAPAATTVTTSSQAA